MLGLIMEFGGGGLGFAISIQDRLARLVGDLAARFIFRRGLNNLAVQATDFYGDVSETRFNLDDFAAQFAAFKNNPAHAERGRMAQHQFSEAISGLVRAEDSEDHARTILLHLNRGVI